jgi:hypothetical protein
MCAEVTSLHASTRLGPRQNGSRSRVPQLLSQCQAENPLPALVREEPICRGAPTEHAKEEDLFVAGRPAEQSCHEISSAQDEFWLPGSLYACRMPR